MILKKQSAGGSARWGNTAEGLALAAREQGDEGIRGFRNVGRRATWSSGSHESPVKRGIAEAFMDMGMAIKGG